MELEKINAFFNDHLLKVEYFGFDAEARSAALSMAEHDIAAELGREPQDDDYLELAAVGEQTIHLLQHPGTESAEHLVEERVEGVGSRRYAHSEMPGIAPRARRYLRALLGATVSLSRG
jgi:hypothetical protein